MNLGILLKSMKLAFRSKRRVLSFIVIYSILIVLVAKGIQGSAGSLLEMLLWPLTALVVATVYAILISQFRKRDVSILKCIGWTNHDVMLLVVGEVVVVSLAAFFLVFQVSVEILGLVAYFEGLDTGLLQMLLDLIAVEWQPMLVTLIYIVVLQLPGVGLAHYRMMKIPPMQALREE
ncbi:MAG: FtsX-like permease family protein [Candidatus Thorarchaeota archaeon]